MAHATAGQTEDERWSFLQNFHLDGLRPELPGFLGGAGGLLRGGTPGRIDAREAVERSGLTLVAGEAGVVRGKRGGAVLGEGGFFQEVRSVDLVASPAEGRGGEQPPGRRAVGCAVSRRGGSGEGSVQIHLQGAVGLAAVPHGAVAAHAADGLVSAVAGGVAAQASIPGGTPPGRLDVGKHRLEHRRGRALAVARGAPLGVLFGVARGAILGTTAEREPAALLAARQGKREENGGEEPH